MTALLIALARKYGLMLALVLALVGGYLWWAHTERAIGARDAINASLAVSLAEQAHRVDSLRHVSRVDTVRLTRYVTRWDTAYAEVFAHDTVTLTRADTVRVPVSTLVLADSTIRVCRETVSDCMVRAAAESTLAVQWQQKAETLTAGKLSGFRNIVGTVLKIAVGYELARITIR